MRRGGGGAVGGFVRSLTPATAGGQRGVARSGQSAGTQPMAHPPTHEGDLAAVRGQLGDPAVAAAWAEGDAMTLEEAVAHALREDTA